MFIWIFHAKRIDSQASDKAGNVGRKMIKKITMTWWYSVRTGAAPLFYKCDGLERGDKMYIDAFAKNLRERVMCTSRGLATTAVNDVISGNEPFIDEYW